jgi:TolA-binding protein
VIELVRQLEGSQRGLARLRGQLEVLANENQQIQKRQRDFYLDLDSRLKRLEAGSGAASSPPSDGGGAGIANSAATAPSATAHALTKEDQARRSRHTTPPPTSSGETTSRQRSRRSVRS